MTVRMLHPTTSRDVVALVQLCRTQHTSHRLLQSSLKYKSCKWQHRPLHVNSSLPRLARLGNAKGVRNYSTVSEASQPPSSAESFLHGHTATYINDMYMQWKASPQSVHASWQSYFSKMENGTVPAFQAFQGPPELFPRINEEGKVQFRPSAMEALSNEAADQAKVQLLVQAYQSMGHQKADIDPLKIRGLCDGSYRGEPKELKPQFYGFTPADMEREFMLGNGVLDTFYSEERKTMKLKDIIAMCEKIYCGTHAIEYQHITDREKQDWIRRRIEVEQPLNYSVDDKKQILDRMIWSATFENFLASKFPTKKRYGLEGGESFTPGIKALVDRSVEHGVDDIVIGSQHRGRLSMLCNVLRKPASQMFYEFTSRVHAAVPEQSGDVNTHLGLDFTRTTPSGKKVNLSLLANPSHLEAEDPVAAGKTRGIHHFKDNQNQGIHHWSKTLCLTIHGDAAIAGQGVVYETFGLSNLSEYSTGGTIHIVVNNQIGFTTDPRKSRSTPYCTDIAKAFDCPIFHVNGDDVEAVTRMCELAADWRAHFHTDCVVDIICYRKHGHNEMDQPLFTQPLMYDRVSQKIPILDQYIQKLVKEGTFTADYIAAEQAKIWQFFEKSFEESQSYEPSPDETGLSKERWSDMKIISQLSTETLLLQPTATSSAAVSKIADAFAAIPEGFRLHRNVQRLLDTRIKSLRTGADIDWSTAEALAFGTLCTEGYHVRVSGQDVERGTFSQRHAIKRNQITDVAQIDGPNNLWIPLDRQSPDQARFVVTNSPLSEFSVLGFEYGYSLASPKALVMWEAQFGDFANNAQCIIDQFIAPGEAKWLQQSGLVLSLPHGYDGQGPEHSSARIERFLQLCNGSEEFPSPEQLPRTHQTCNMQVANVTTPANLFHILRRQMHRQFRKPLILPFSKSLLRHPLTKSFIAEFLEGSKFMPVIRDAEFGVTNAPDIRKVLLCSGQVYAKLIKHRAGQAQPVTDTVITRVEELHPFPWEEIRSVLDSYPNADEIVWCQEEPKNGGAWAFVSPRLDNVLGETAHHRGKWVKYVGRPASASTASGLKAVHDVEEAQLMQRAFA